MLMGAGVKESVKSTNNDSRDKIRRRQKVVPSSVMRIELCLSGHVHADR